MKLTLKSNLIIAFLLLIASSCQKETVGLDGEKDYIIFGSYYGFCPGECATTYLLKNDGLYKSTGYIKMGKLSSFSERLSEEKFNKVKGFDQRIPSEFLNEKKAQTTFGCPDCLDQGGLFLEIHKGGQSTRFNIDNFTDSLPEHVRSVALEIRANIEIASK